MGKRKKTKKQKKSKFDRICKRCGNDVFSPKPFYKCPFCGENNKED